MKFAASTDAPPPASVSDVPATQSPVRAAREHRRPGSASLTWGRSCPARRGALLWVDQDPWWSRRPAQHPLREELLWGRARAQGLCEESSSHVPISQGHRSPSGFTPLSWVRFWFCCCLHVCGHFSSGVQSPSRSSMRTAIGPQTPQNIGIGRLPTNR